MKRPKTLRILLKGLTAKFVLVTILAVLAVMTTLGIFYTVYQRKTLDAIKELYKEAMIEDYETTEEALLALGDRSIDNLAVSSQDKGYALARLMSSIGIDPLLGHDADILDRHVLAISNNRDVVYAVYLDRNGKILTHSSPEPEDTKNLLNIILPVQLGETILGTAKIGLSKESFQSQILHLENSVSATVEMQKEGMADRLRIASGFMRRTVTKGVMFIILATIIISFILVVLISMVGRKIVINPVKELSATMNSFLMGDLTARVRPNKVLKCWEMKECDKDYCPAFNNAVRPCWHIADTRCPSCVEGGYREKIENCKKCDVYMKGSGDEIQHLVESFNVMAISLSEHISGLTETKEELGRKLRLLQTRLDVTPDVVGLQDAQLAYQAVNKAFCQFVSRKEEEVVGKSDFDIFPQKLAEKNYHESLKVLETGKPVEREQEFEMPNRSWWLHIVKVPVRDPDSNISGVLWEGRDITEFKQMQATLLQSQKMESVGQLAAGVAHEINTPLGIILGYAQLLKEDFDEHSSVYEDLGVIEKQSKICRNIVSDLLGFSRHTESTVSSVDINESIDQVVSVVEHTYKLDRVTIEKNFASELPPITGDLEKLKQVLINLLGNAHDAIGSDGTITISTNFDKKNDMVTISVADTGQGISPENLEKVFDPFFTTKAVGKGTGLGLSVTFGIVQEHGGKIEVQSPLSGQQHKEDTDGKGTVFIVHLPVKRGASLDSGKEEIKDG